MTNISSADEDGFMRSDQFHLLDLCSVSEHHIQMLVPSFEHARVISRACFNDDFLLTNSLMNVNGSISLLLNAFVVSLSAITIISLQS